MGDSTKTRILYLLKYLFQHTDEDHKVTTNELIDHLATQGFKENRKTVKDDIDTLTVAGYDIVIEREKYMNSFYFGMIKYLIHGIL